MNITTNIYYVKCLLYFLFQSVRSFAIWPWFIIFNNRNRHNLGYKALIFASTTNFESGPCFTDIWWEKLPNNNFENGFNDLKKKKIHRIWRKNTSIVCYVFQFYDPKRIKLVVVILEAKFLGVVNLWICLFSNFRRKVALLY